MGEIETVRRGDGARVFTPRRRGARIWRRRRARRTRDARSTVRFEHGRDAQSGVRGSRHGCASRDAGGGALIHGWTHLVSSHGEHGVSARFRVARDAGDATRAPGVGRVRHRAPGRRKHDDAETWRRRGRPPAHHADAGVDGGARRRRRGVAPVRLHRQTFHRERVAGLCVRDADGRVNRGWRGVYFTRNDGARSWMDADRAAQNDRGASASLRRRRRRARAYVERATPPRDRDCSTRRRRARFYASSTRRENLASPTCASNPRRALDRAV